MTSLPGRLYGLLDARGASVILSAMRIPAPARQIVERWTREVRDALSDALVGVQIGGSLALDDFQPGWSDVDLFAVLARPASASDVERIRRIHAALCRDFVDAGRGGWESGQAVECVFLTREMATEPDLRGVCCVAGDNGAERVEDWALLPFDRHVLARFGRHLCGERTAFAPSRPEDLRAQTASGVAQLDPARADRESPIWLASVLHWLARSIVFWRDGEALSKTAALDREIARDSPFAQEFELARSIRRQGSRTATGHEAELRRAFRDVASRAADQLTAGLDGLSGSR